MKKIITVVLLVFVITVPALAKDIVTLPNDLPNGQAMFKDISRDLGLALSYYPLSPAQSLAGNLIPFGFDAGVEVTAVQLDTTKDYWKAMGADAPGTLPIPKLHIQAGFKIPLVPFIPPIDIGVIYSKIPTTEIALTGGEVKIGILEDGLVMPAVALRGSMTKLSGLEKTIEISTQQFDLSVSKKFLLLTPYAGYGMVMITSTPKDAAAVAGQPAIGIPGLTKEEITESKLFAGLKFSLGLINFVAEYAQSAVTAYSFRANVSF